MKYVEKLKPLEEQLKSNDAFIQIFLSFTRDLLTYHPQDRPSAREVLYHSPIIVYMLQTS
jgi:hypothetical protein